MPKKTLQRVLDIKRTASTSGSGLVYVGVAPGGGGISDHGLLTGLGDDDHPLYALKATTVTAGAGLTGTGTLGAALTLAVGAGDGITVNADDVALASTTAGAGLTYTTGVLAVGAGNGLTVNANDVALTTPGTLTATTTNTASGNHTHAITAVTDASGGVSALLRSGSGGLTLDGLTTALWVRTPKVENTAGTLTFDSLDDVVSIAASNTLKTANYASQTTGWSIDYTGGADFRYLFVDEMHAKKFVADLEQALAGGQIIAKSVGMLGATFTAPAAGATATLTMRDLPSAPNMAIFESGDIVLVRNFSRAAGSLSISNCWGVVTSYADQSDGTQTWTFTRSSGGNAGAMTAGTTVAVDSIVLDYGVTGNGTHEINAIDGAYGLNSPYSQVVTWTTHPATGQTVRTRLGNLRGLFSVANEYGLYAGSGVTDTDTYIRLSSYTNRLNNLPMEWWIGGAKIVTIDSTSGIDVATTASMGGSSAYTMSAAGTTYAGLFGIRNTGTGIADVALMAGDWSGAGMNGGLATTNLYLRAVGDGTGHAYLQAYGDETHPTTLHLVGTTTPWAEISSVWSGFYFLVGGDLRLTGNLTSHGAYNLDLAYNDSVKLSIVTGGADVTGALGVTGGITTNGATSTLGVGLDASTALLRIGHSRTGTGDGAAAIYMTTDATYTDYGLRFLRNAGANGTTNIAHRGTGTMTINLNEAADFQLNTSATKRFSILSDGKVGIGNITPGSLLDVDGNIRGLGVFADGEPGGIASTVGLTNGTQGVSTGTGTVKVNGTTARDSTGWLKIYVGTDIRYIPYWTTVTG